MKRAVVLFAVLAAPSAWAGTLADALKRHAPADVEALRARRDDIAARCTLGAVYARRSDLSRAALYLDGCKDATLPDEVSADIARTTRELERQLRDSDLAIVEVITHPDHMDAEIDALPGETFATPATLYVKAGTYKVTATKDGVTWKGFVVVEPHSRAPVILGEEHAAPGKPNKEHKIDFSDDQGAETQHSGPPPNVKHGSMIKGRMAAGLAASGAKGDDPNGLQDPLAVHDDGPQPTRADWLGLRIGGGVFDDGASAARPGLAIAATVRHALATSTFLAGRLDWSRRGGDAGDALDVLGASAGLGRTLADTRAINVAVVGQLRGDLRLASDRGDAMMTSVHRAGVTVAGALEFALPRTPFSAGLRFEQGLTPIVPGARDRALLLEVGVDWR